MVNANNQTKGFCNSTYIKEVLYCAVITEVTAFCYKEQMSYVKCKTSHYTVIKLGI